MILQQIIKKLFCSRAYQKVIIYYRSTKDKKVLQLKKLEYPCHSRKSKKLEYPCHSRELKKTARLNFLAFFIDVFLGCTLLIQTF